jgi:pseudouridine synthase
MRLQKFLSRAGIASLRRSEVLIQEGRVSVNDKTITKLGTKINPDIDRIKVDNKNVFLTPKKIYILLNKPIGYITTANDPKYRPCVMDLLKNVKTRVYPVGRLDKDTEGLLLLTNDGDSTYALTHPKYEVEKEYFVRINGTLDAKNIEKLSQGILLEDGLTSPAKINDVKSINGQSTFKIIIHEGKKRQIRRMIEAVGHEVVELKRIRISQLKLGNLPLGKFRYLTSEEIDTLNKSCRIM